MYILHCRPFLAFCKSVAVNAVCETHPAFNEERKCVLWAGCGKTMRKTAFQNEKIGVLHANDKLPDKVKQKIQAIILDNLNYTGHDLTIRALVDYGECVLDFPMQKLFRIIKTSCPGEALTIGILAINVGGGGQGTVYY